MTLAFDAWGGTHADRQGIHGENSMQDDTATSAQAQTTGPREAYLVGIWSELLDMDVKPSDNFFDIGGNSMLAIQMSERVVKETGVRIKLMQLAVQSLGEIAADLPDVAVPGARSSSGRLLGRVKRLLGAASVRD
ncbi:MAG TPA: acyl carrier protein [Luteimonas sp.]